MIGRLAVITVDELAPGYRLAGAATFEAATAAEAETLLRETIASMSDVSVVAVHEPFLHALDPVLVRKYEARVVPVLVGLPEAGRPEAAALRRERLASLLHRAIGYRMSFGREEP